MDALYELITKHLSSEYKIVPKESVKALTEDGLKEVENVECDVFNDYNEIVKAFQLRDYIAETFGVSTKHAICFVSAWLLRNGMTDDDRYLRALDPNDFSGLVFPIIERVHSRLLANDIVRVEPLATPVGNLFYFTPQQGSKWKRFWNKCWMKIKKIFINKKI